MEGRDGALRPEYRPTLPVLLQTRRGVRPGVAAAVFAVVVAILGFLLATRGPWADPRTEITHREDLVFRIAYPDERMRRAPAQPGELERIVGRRRSLALTLTVRRFQPASPVDVAPFGALPLYAHDHIRGLQSSVAGFDLREERHLRVNWAPGYDIRFRYAGGMYGRDMLVFPEEDSRTDGVLLSLRYKSPRGQDAIAATRDDVSEAHRALRSFAYGLE